MKEIFSTDFAGRPISVKANYMAGQANGSALVTYGDTVVLVTAVSVESRREGLDFLPLTVDYQEMTFAAGKIPGGFFKREGRPNEREVLTSRIIDRSVRPLFPKGYVYETQIVATVLSADSENNPDVAAMLGASAAYGLVSLTHSYFPRTLVFETRLGQKRAVEILEKMAGRLPKSALARASHGDGESSPSRSKRAAGVRS